MARWPIEDRLVEEISLDMRNVRIPGDGLDDAAIANYLVDAAELLELARDILRDGYIDNELPVVVVEDGRTVVLEGNRRASALKAIKDPEFLGRSAARMRRLLTRYPDHDTPIEIRVMIAPSRAAAQPLLARMHTRNPKKSWIREQQAVFYHAQLSRSVTVDNLRSQYPSESKLIPGFIRMGEMRSLIRALSYSDPELEAYVKDSHLKMTVLEYAYDQPKIQEALGISFSKDGMLTPKRLNREQKRGLTYILGRFKDKTLNTRSPEFKMRNVEEQDEFAALLKAVMEGRSPARQDTGENDAGSENSDDTSDEHDNGAGGMSLNAPGDGGAQGAGAAPQSGNGAGSASQGGGSANGAASSGGARGPNRANTLSRLNMDGFEYKGASGGLRIRFEELRRLDVRDFANAALDLVRTVLECSIKDYFAAQSNRQLLAGRTMGACITELAKAYSSDQRMTTLINAINRSGRLPAGQFAGTATALNATNHEPDLFVTGPEVHEAWEKIKPILIEIVGK